MLQVCESWSLQAGMEFSPTKCVCFAPPPDQQEHPLCPYGVDLPSAESAPYLGYPFTKKGISFAHLYKERCAKARAVVATLQPMGMNATGWAPAAAANVFKMFVRPVMEYGLKLHAPGPAQLAVYQCTQNMALHTILSAPPPTHIHQCTSPHLGYPNDEGVLH